VFLFSISVSLFSKPVLSDSIGVKKDDGRKVIIFKVKAKDTYSSIGRRYNVSPKEIMKYNGAKKEVLAIDAVISVPTNQPFKGSSKAKNTGDATAKETKKQKRARLEREAEEANASKKHKHKNARDDSGDSVPVTTVVTGIAQQPREALQQPAAENDTPPPPPTQYKVSAGETLYAISKRFNTTVDDITKVNNLTSTNLTPGQVLSVRTGYHAPPPAPAPAVVHNDTPVTKRDEVAVVPAKDSAEERRFEKNRFGLYEKTEKGVATWIEDTSLDPNKKLVLHRSALIGTVIKITNPMTNRTTFAKVVGRFTDNEQTKDVIIVMTKNVADSLGALDKRFHVNISYGSPNE